MTSVSSNHSAPSGTQQPVTAKKTPREVLFAENNIVETSFHVEICQFDLQLCDDATGVWLELVCLLAECMCVT